MKILMGNNTLDWLAGSEMFALTLATEFRRMGHEVVAYSPQLGFVATKMEAEGIKCVKELDGDKKEIQPFTPYFEEKMNENFDVIICSHYEITKHLHFKYPKIPIIGIVHGILHKNPQTGEIWPEHPVNEIKILGGFSMPLVDQYIAVSEEVQNLLKDVYQIDSKLMMNFFDLERFKKEGKLNEKPKKILVNSNYWGVEDDINKVIKEVANHYEAQLLGIGVNFAPTFEVNEIIRDVDIVFGMGRSVLEGACMGKLAVCHGRWGTGGVLNMQTIPELRKTNFSGRPVKGEGRLWTSEQIIHAIDDNFNQKNVDEVYEYMAKEHNVKIAAKQYIEIAENLLATTYKK